MKICKKALQSNTKKEQESHQAEIKRNKEQSRNITIEELENVIKELENKIKLQHRW